jgi:hypothetical protein
VKKQGENDENLFLSILPIFSTFFTPMITYADVETAYTVVRPVVHKTPLLHSELVDGRIGNEVFFKAENLQRIGAFKIRGAYNKIASLTAEERARGGQSCARGCTGSVAAGHKGGRRHAEEFTEEQSGGHAGTRRRSGVL